MAVEISGVNNNDKITATDGSLDLLSVTNFSSEVTVPSFKVGSNIQLGNAGVATATTFVGNLTGNVNATSNLLLQIGGSEKFRVASSGQLGIGGANYGTSGQVLTSGGSGSAATWSTISGTTINSNTNNYLITGTGTANTLQGEAGLTYDGSQLVVRGSDTVTSSGGTKTVALRGGDANNEKVNLSFETGAGGPIAVISGIADATGVYPNTTGSLTFNTQVGGGVFERLRIKSDGTSHFYGNQTTAPEGDFGFRWDRNQPVNLQITNTNNSSVNAGAKITLKSNIGTFAGSYYNNGGFYLINSANGYFNYYSNSVLRININTNGDVFLNPDDANGIPTTNGAVGRRFGVKSTANNIIIGETTQSGSGYGLHIESRQTGRSGGARIAQIGLKNDASGNGQISFFTSPSGADVSERMVINSSGYVTKPNHPSFCARHQGSDGFSGNIIVLTRISTSWDVWNIGGHYSTSTGKFTAPVAGVYYFEGQLMTTGHSNGDNIQDMFSLESNRGRITYVRQRESYFSNSTNANGYYTNSLGSSVRLSAGDTVWLQRNGGQSWGYSNRYYSYFTGWLIG